MNAYELQLKRHNARVDAARLRSLTLAFKSIQTKEQALEYLIRSASFLEKKYYNGKEFISCITDVEPRHGEPINDTFQAWVNLHRALEVLGLHVEEAY